MLRPRIIPSLLVHEGGLVKTVGFTNPIYVGDPINAVKIFNEKEADELAVFDMDSTANASEPDFRMIANLAAECRMPLCYGGGVSAASQAKRIVGLGVEKVAVSAAAVQRPELIGEMAAEVGSQSVVVVIDARKKRLWGGYEVMTHNGRRSTGLEAIAFAREAERQGAGEILINSIDEDGKMSGYDLGLAEKLRSAVSVPITIQGGAGSLEDIKILFERVGTVGAAAGSLFVFKGTYRAVLISYPQPHAKDRIVQLVTRAAPASAA